jgi:hypothetical protein
MRSGTPRSTVRGLVAGVVTALAAAAAVTAGGAAFAPAALADEPDELAVGAQLEALVNVKIAQAELAKGSRVNVAQLVRRHGRLSAVDVELADGYVTRVAILTVRSSFRVVTD